VKVIEGKRNGDEKKFVMPKKCPVCGSEVHREEGEAISRCTESRAPSWSAAFATSPRARARHRRLGDKLCEQLIEGGLGEADAISNRSPSES